LQKVFFFGGGATFLTHTVYHSLHGSAELL